MGEHALMARPRQRGVPVATVDLASKPISKTSPELIKRVLSDPTLYPDEMTAWLPRFLNTNVNLQLTQAQLPKPEAQRSAGGVGEAQFLNGWSNAGGVHGAVCYYRDPYDRVHLCGAVASGTVGLPVLRLPGGFKPDRQQTFAVASNDALGICAVTTSGDVIAVVGSPVYFSLAGVSFRQFA